MLVAEDLTLSDAYLKAYNEADGVFCHKAGLHAVEKEVLKAVAKWIESQRNNVPATGEEFAEAIRFTFLQN